MQARARNSCHDNGGKGLAMGRRTWVAWQVARATRHISVSYCQRRSGPAFPDFSLIDNWVI